MSSRGSETSRRLFESLLESCAYEDPQIPVKYKIPYMPLELMEKHLLKSYDLGGLQPIERVDNNAQLMTDRENDEEEEKNVRRPMSGINLKGELVAIDASTIKFKFLQTDQNKKATLQFKNGFKYQGDIQLGLLHGQGKLITPEVTYIGDFKRNEIEGKGIYQWQDMTYEGQVERGARNGEGTMKLTNGAQYTGQWREGKRHGHGKLQYVSGASYVGDFQAGLRHGQGVMIYATGNKYEGAWENDKPNGQGVMNWFNLNERYVGEWKDGKQHGFGVHIWLEGRGKNNIKQLRNRYIGHWRDGVRNGNGVFYYANGSKYEGQWENNQKHGQGILTFEDGSVYEGPFDHDRMVNRLLSGAVDVTVESPDTKLALTKTQKGKTMSTMRARAKEVQANPYDTLIDFQDLIEFEADPAQSKKEVLNMLLKFNSQIRQ